MSINSLDRLVDASCTILILLLFPLFLGSRTRWPFNETFDFILRRNVLKWILNVIDDHIDNLARTELIFHVRAVNC